MAEAMEVDALAGGGERPSDKELFLAAESGDAAPFSSRDPASLAAALSLRNEDGRSLLHVAAASGHPKATAVASLGNCPQICSADGFRVWTLFLLWLSDGVGGHRACVGRG